MLGSKVSRENPDYLHSVTTSISGSRGRGIRTRSESRDPREPERAETCENETRGTQTGSRKDGDRSEHWRCCDGRSRDNRRRRRYDRWWYRCGQRCCGYRNRRRNGCRARGAIERLEARELCRLATILDQGDDGIAFLLCLFDAFALVGLAERGRVEATVLVRTLCIERSVNDPVRIDRRECNAGPTVGTDA